MIGTILSSVISLATKLVATVTKPKAKDPKLDPPLSKLESEKLAASMLDRARKMAEEEKARKRKEGGKP